MIVTKFGGTSVGDVAAIDRTVEIVRSRLDRSPIVVTSATAGTTNALVAIAEQAAHGHLIGAVRAVEGVRDRHLALCETLLAAEGVDVSCDVGALCDELASLAEALSILGDLTSRSRDAIAAIGEQLSAPMLAATLRLRGIRAEHVDARSVMITDATFTKAEPRTDDIAARARELVLPLLRDGIVPVLGGYIGATPDGVTTTLGRGGSDFSASLFGAALDADAIEIWTDVDGILTADPRVVPAARPVEVIRFDEAAELASFGAKVLHPSTIAPAVQRGIPVFVLNSHRPHERGTRITFDAPRRGVTAIASRTGVSLLRVTAARMLLAEGFVQRVFEIVARNRTSVDVVATSEVTISMTLDDDTRMEDLVAELRHLGDVAIERGRGIVAIVGSGIGDDGVTMGRALAALAGRRIHMASLGATGINLTVVLDGDATTDAMRALHAEFFERAA